MATDLPAYSREDAKTAGQVYILYLVGLLVGATALVGLIIAYVYQADAPAWLRAHYRFQIRTFWIGGLYIGVGVFLWIFSNIGLLLVAVAYLWTIVRCARGLRSLAEGREPVAAASWGF